MSVLPKTLSRDVYKLLGGSLEVSVQIDRLMSNPQILIKCLKQISQAPAWCKQQDQFTHKLFFVVTDMTLRGIIPWGEVAKAVELMFKHHPQVLSLDCIGDLKVSLSDEKRSPISSQHSRLIMMYWCEKLRDRWTKNPDELALSYREIAPEIIISIDFREIYDAMMTYREVNKEAINGGFCKFYNHYLDSLQRKLIQCKEWGYDKGVEELQKIFCERSDDIKSVLFILVVAKVNGFTLMEKYCYKFLDELDVYIHEEGNNRNITMSAYNFEMEDPLTVVGVPAARDRRSLARSYFDYHGGLTLSDAKMDSFDITLQSESFATANSRYLSYDELSVTKAIIPFMEKKKFKSHNLDSLTLSGKSNLSNQIMAGLVLYIQPIKIWLLNYEVVKLDFIQILSQFNPNLLTFRFVDCNKIDKEVLLQIATLFSKLDSFGIYSTSVSKEEMLAISKLKNLSALYLSDCSFSLPEDLSGFLNLHHLDLSKASISFDELQRFFLACKALIGFYGSKAVNLKLNQFPHFATIETMGVSSFHLEEIIEEKERSASIPLLERAPNLKILRVEGNPSSRLKSILVKYIRENRFQILFLGNA